MTSFNIQPKSAKNSTYKTTLLPNITIWPNQSENSKKEILTKPPNDPFLQDSALDNSAMDKFFEVNHSKFDKKALGLSSMHQYRSSSIKQIDSKYKSTSISVPDSFIGTNGIVSPSAMRKEENLKKIILCEKIGQLKHQLSKYQSSEEQSFLPTKMEVKKIINCLEILHDTESSLSDLMKIVIRVLRTGLFVNTKMVDSYYDKLKQDCEQIVENSKKEEVPYYALCNALLKEVTDESHNNKRVEMHNQEVERLEAIIIYNENLVQELQKDLDARIAPEEYEKAVKLYHKQKETNEELLTDQENLKSLMKELSDDCANLRKQIENETTENDRLGVEIMNLERARDAVILETEESRNKVALMKEKIRGFKDIMDQFIVKLGNVKQQVFDLREENTELKYLNEKLSLRAARGFDALTPRPDYRRLQEERKLDFEVFDSTGRRQLMPTMKIIETLWNERKPEMRERKDSLSKRRDSKLILAKTISSASAFKTEAQRLSLANSPAKNGGIITPGRQSLAGEGGLPSDTKQEIGGNGSTSVRNVQNNETTAATKQPLHTLESENNESESGVDLNPISTNKSSLIQKNNEEAFGEETIKQANELIDFAVKSKKVIENFKDV